MSIIKFFVDKNTPSSYRTAFLDTWLFMSPSFRNFKCEKYFIFIWTNEKISNRLKTMLGLSLFVLATIAYIQHDVVAFSSTEGEYQWKWYLLLPWYPFFRQSNVPLYCHIIIQLLNYRCCHKYIHNASRSNLIPKWQLFDV